MKTAPRTPGERARARDPERQTRHPYPLKASEPQRDPSEGPLEAMEGAGGPNADGP